jgi:hypothetical protein
MVMRKPYPLTPALSPRGGEGEREPIFVLFKCSGLISPDTPIGGKYIYRGVIHD